MESSVKLHSAACKQCEKKIISAGHRKCLKRLNAPDEVCPSCQEILCNGCFSLSFCYDLCCACDDVVCNKCGKKCEQLDNNFCGKCMKKLCSRCKYTLKSWDHPRIKEHMESLEIYLSGGSSDESDDQSDDSSEQSEDNDGESSDDSDDEDSRNPHGKSATEKYKQKLREKLNDRKAKEKNAKKNPVSPADVADELKGLKLSDLLPKNNSEKK